MDNKKVDWNGLRDKLHRDLDAYRSIVDFDEWDELMHLENDLISSIREVFLK